MNPFRISRQLSRVKPSVTLAVSAKAKKLQAEGVDVIGLGAGEPDFDTPPHIKDAAKVALDRGETKYTHVAGTPELRRVIGDELHKAHGLSFAPEQIVVSCGAKHSLFNLFQALLDPDDEVIIPAPYWVSYPDIVRLAGGTPVIVETTAKDGFRISPAQLRAAITDKTRAIILCSPGNPTGACYDRDALDALRVVLEEHQVLAVSDDIYRRLTYGDFKFQQIATLSPKMAELTVVIDGLSKAYAMTGWRVGFAAAPTEVAAAMGKLQGQSTSNVNSVAQAAAIAALTGPQDCVEQMRQAFDGRRKLVLKALRAIDHVTCHEPRGAFYAFPDLSHYLGKRSADRAIADDVALADYLLDKGKVAVVPGSAFGAPGFVRLSYATSEDNLVRGLQRIGDALTELN